MNKYQPIIGLEVHVELKTKTKIFCCCSAQYFGHKPNTHCCPVCLGLPGALPVPNKTAIEWCLKIGLALNCDIPLVSKFDRKNYFYPDLPKGYQISQYDLPFCVDGWVDIKSKIRNPKSETNPKSQIRNSKRIRIRRVHQEEDTGKLIHAEVDGERVTLIDFNRSGVPLVEIVTEPDFESGKEVKEYLQKLQQIVRYLGVSDADMEKGEMRLEPNISIYTNTSGESFGHPRGGRLARRSLGEAGMDSSGVDLPKYKVEVKNINSFRFVEKAIDYEIERQRKIIETGEIPEQETRGWDEKKQITVSQRTKEKAHDYRYFPEPDIPPLRWSQDQISKIKNQISELPDAKISRFMKNYQLSEYDANILTTTLSMADYFEEAIRVARGISNIKYQISNKQIANYIINKKVDINKILPAELIQTILSATQTTTIAQEELEKIIAQVLSENPKAVEDYKKGKEEVIMFLIGQIMQATKGQAKTELIRELLQKYVRS